MNKIFNESERIKINIINPKSMDLNQLYGYKNEIN